MNQKLIIGIVAIVIIAGGVAIYSSNSSKTQIMEKGATAQKEKNAAPVAEKEAMMKKDEVAITDKKTEGAMANGAQAMMKTGAYVEYASEKIAMASANYDVVLFFRASWCPTCKAVDEDIKSHLKDIPESLTILDVNYDNSTDLKKKYGVTYQHTFVQVDAQGNLIKKWVGSPTLASLVSEVK